MHLLCQLHFIIYILPFTQFVSLLHQPDGGSLSTGINSDLQGIGSSFFAVASVVFDGQFSVSGLCMRTHLESLSAAFDGIAGDYVLPF